MCDIYNKSVLQVFFKRFSEDLWGVEQGEWDMKMNMF